MSKTAQIDNAFTYHKPFGTQPQRYEEIRAKAREFAHFIDQSVPDSREKSCALTALEESVMWANKAIACNENEGDTTVQNAQAAA